MVDILYCMFISSEGTEPGDLVRRENNQQIVYLLQSNSFQGPQQTFLKWPTAGKLLRNPFTFERRKSLKILKIGQFKFLNLITNFHVTICRFGYLVKKKEEIHIFRSHQTVNLTQSIFSVLSITVYNTVIKIKDGPGPIRLRVPVLNNVL